MNNLNMNNLENLQGRRICLLDLNYTLVSPVLRKDGRGGIPDGSH